MNIITLFRCMVVAAMVLISAVSGGTVTGATAQSSAGAECPLKTMKIQGINAGEVQCTNKMWLVEFYTEPELINKVGWIQCDCFSPQKRSGTPTIYPKWIYVIDCPWNM